MIAAARLPRTRFYGTTAQRPAGGVHPERKGSPRGSWVGLSAAAIREAAGGGADVLSDVIADTPTPDPTMACIDALRARGTAVLVGGVRHDLPIDYRWVRSGELCSAIRIIVSQG